MLLNSLLIMELLHYIFVQQKIHESRVIIKIIYSSNCHYSESTISILSVTNFIITKTFKLSRLFLSNKKCYSSGIRFMIMMMAYTYGKNKT